jgi:hypothetical protein
MLDRGRESLIPSAAALLFLFEAAPPIKKRAGSRTYVAGAQLFRDSQ